MLKAQKLHFFIALLEYCTVPIILGNELGN